LPSDEFSPLRIDQKRRRLGRRHRLHWWAYKAPRPPSWFKEMEGKEGKD